MAYNLTYGITQLPGGWLADRIGPRTVLTIGVAGVAVVGLLISLSTTYVIMALFLVLLGVTGGGYHPAAAPLVSASVEPRKRGRALGLHQIGGSGSFFLVPLIVAGITGSLGWRGTFVAISVPSITFGIIFFILLGRLRYNKNKVEQSRSAMNARVPLTQRQLRHLVALIILSIVSVVLVYSTISFIPLFVVDHFEGVSNEAAAAMLSLAYIGGLLAAPLGGYLSDRLGAVPVLIAVGFIAGPAIYMLNLVPLGVGFSVVLVIIGMTLFLGMPVAEHYIINHTTERKRSTVLGIYYLGSRGGPAIAPAIGYLLDHYGFYIGFSIVGATMVVVAISCTILMWRSRD